ncbi:hypothetical protein ACKWTF_016167 [Chironomus riparius]
MHKESRILILLLFFTSSISAEKLKCKYFGIYQNYMCEMSNVFNSTKEITSVAGEHINGKGIPDVKAFYVKRESLTKYVPTKVCSSLYNINIMNINGYFLVEINKNIFFGCPKLNHISIENIDLKELDEDLLAEAPSIEKFSLSYTKVEVLKKNFFKNNQKLKWVVMRTNNFKIIETEFPPTITYLSITNNLCVNGHYISIMTDAMTLSAFAQKVYDKCSNRTNETETKFMSYDAIKSRIIDEQAKDHRDKIMTLFEEFQTINFKLNWNKLSSLQNSYIQDRINITNELRSTLNRLDKLQASAKNQMEIVMRVTSLIEKDSNVLEDELEKKSFELQDINIELLSKVINIYVVIILLMCLQFLMASCFAIYGYYHRYY